MEWTQPEAAHLLALLRDQKKFIRMPYNKDVTQQRKQKNVHARHFKVLKL
jgi:hypothetical protein